MTIKFWIYIFTDLVGKQFVIACTEDDTLSVPAKIGDGQGDAAIKHYLLPAWCQENGCQCRVVVKDIEI